MLAGAIELNNKLQIGRQLKNLANQPQGLAQIPFDISDCWSDGKTTLVQQLNWNTAQSKQVTGITTHAQTGMRITAWARIDNRQELQKQLPEQLQPLGQTDPGIILAGYLHWHEAVCERLVGDFCFAIHDPRSDSLFCGRDHLGMRPFYYYWLGDVFVFASSIAVLSKLTGLDLELSEQWLAKFLLDCSQDWQRTAYKHIEKLPPAHQLQWVATKPQCKRYFSFAGIEPIQFDDLQTCRDAYLEQLTEAVRCRTQTSYAVGTESSGGLDSSSVTALASQCMQDPIKNLHAFGSATYQREPERIMAVSQMTPLAMTHLITGSGQHITNRTALREQFFQSNGVPEEHPDAMYMNRYYQTAEQLGIRTMLSGYGGDEFVTTPGELALDELWRTRQIIKFIDRQAGSRCLRPLRAVKWLARRRWGDSTSPMTIALGKIYAARWEVRLVQESVCERYALEQMFKAQIQHDSQRSSLNEFLLEECLSPTLTARLENCTLLAARHKIEYRWPLLDVRLIRFFLSVPAEYKYGPGGVIRYLHRTAVADLVPDQVAWRSKDMGPYVGATPEIVENRQEKFLPHPTLQPLIHQANLERLARDFRQLDAADPESWLEFENYYQFIMLNHWLHYTFPTAAKS